jgi:uncharacterized protein
MRVAVIGTGIAGNAAAWTLSKRYPVTVYDRELRPGGHSHTVSIVYNGFNEADHGERDGSSLRIYAQRRAAEHDIDLTGSRVLLLCYPRLLGYTFNPLSVYSATAPTAAMRYHFRVAPPREHVKLRILETDLEGPLLAATFNGRRSALTTAALLRSFFSLPLVTFKIVAAIHWEALRLWLKGARLVPRPDAAPANAAFNTGLASGEHNDYTGAALSAVGREPGLRESALVR